MPIYVYTCHTCELELEELHPLGQAPEQSIRCPICGGYFVRDMALVNFRRLAQGKPAQNWSSALDLHGFNCRCCPPHRAGRSQPSFREENDE